MLVAVIAAVGEKHVRPTGLESAFAAGEHATPSSGCKQHPGSTGPHKQPGPPDASRPPSADTLDSELVRRCAGLPKAFEALLPHVQAAFHQFRLRASCDVNRQSPTCSTSRCAGRARLSLYLYPAIPIPIALRLSDSSSTSCHRNEGRSPRNGLRRSSRELRTSRAL